MNLRNFLRKVFKRAKVEEELRQEIAFHLEMEANTNLRGGLDSASAQQTALRSFGGVEQVKESCRDAWGTRFLDNLRQDLGYGLRGLRRNPGFSFVVVLTLALGIGANTAIFSIVHGVLWRPLPYQEPAQLALITQAAPGAGLSSLNFSVLDFTDFRARNRAFAALSEYHSMWFILLGRPDPQRLQTGVVSDNFFELLGVSPILGRGFLPGEDLPGAAPVLILSHDYWQREFRGDPQVIGQTLELNNKVHTVVGVLPPLTAFPNVDQVFMPAAACPFRGASDTLRNRQGRLISHVFGRLKKGVSPALAEEDVRRVGVELCSAFPQDYPKNSGYRAGMQSLASAVVGDASAPLIYLLATSSFVLLIACANVANLNLSRLMRRDRELAVRTALGAGRLRIYRQLLTESTLLALAGGAAGLVFARGGLYLFIQYASRFLPRANEIRINTPVLLFTLGISLVAAFVFNARPRLFIGPELLTKLKDGSRGSVGGRARLRSLLVVLQVAISMPLLIGAGLAARSLLALQQIDPGLQTDKVLAARIDLNWTRYNDAPKQLDFWERILGEVVKLPGAEKIAISGAAPLNGLFNAPTPFRLEGAAAQSGAPAPRAAVLVTSEDYFDAIGQPLVRGRKFSASDKAEAPPVVIINQSLAARYWPNEEAVGRRITFDDGKSWATIVGVAANARQQLDSAPVDEIHYPLRAAGGLLNASILVRTTGSPASLARELRSAIHAVDPQQPIDRIEPLEKVREAALAPHRLIATLLGLFALLALIITATGLCGVLAFSVTQRTHEIGIRMALGADRGNVLWMVLRQGVILVSLGLAGGVIAAMLLHRASESILFGVEATDPVTFILVTVVLLSSALVACLFPALRATSVEPVVALRAE